MPQTNPAKFLSEVKNELTKVIWPTRQEVVRLTAVVVIISLIVGLFIGGLDFLFTKGIQLFLGR